VGMDRHLNLIGSEVLDRVGHFGMEVETRYHKLLQKSVRHDLL